LADLHRGRAAVSARDSWISRSAISAVGPALGVLLAVAAVAATAESAGPPATTAEKGAPENAGEAAPIAASPVDGKLLYALGVIVSSGIENFQLSESEFAQVSAGIADGYRHRADVSQAMSYDPQLQVLRRARVQAMTEHEKDAGQAYLATVAATRGAKKTASGLVYLPITEGKGARPSFKDAVRLNYEGKLVDGSVFDSSAARGAPATFLLSNVMPCFTEALQLMRVGGKSLIICPSALAYGDRGSAPRVRPGATVEYDVELLAVVQAQAPSENSAMRPAATTPAGPND
jgi:FKBP-type peptidyl-prolyl cis-trans isomerase FkpA